MRTPCENYEILAGHPPRLARPAFEGDLLRFLAEGKSRKEIAFIAGRKCPWVNLHIARMRSEAKATTDAQLVANAFRNGIIR